MLPILFTIGSWPISSFGLFLGLALLFSTFIIWRIGRVYDLDEEKVVDLVLLTFFGGFITARIYYVIFHPGLFSDWTRIFLINNYPGLSFWGGFLGGIFVLWFFVKRFKLHFWQIADFASVGIFLGLSLSSIGCFFGGCEPGLPSNSIIAVKMVGLVGKRMPIQIVESILFFLAYLYLWRSILKFHFPGKIFIQALFFLGSIKFLLEFFREDVQKIGLPFSLGHIYSLVVCLIAVWVYYQQSRRSILKDMKFIAGLLFNKSERKLATGKLVKKWYNVTISWKLMALRSFKFFMRKINIKQNPAKF